MREAAKICCSRLGRTILILVRDIHGIERRLYPCLQIFGGGEFLATFVRQVAAGSDDMILWVTGAVAVLGLTGALLAVRWFDQRKDAALWCGLFWAVQVLTFASPVASYSFFTGAQLLLRLDPMYVKLSLKVLRLGIEFVVRGSQEGPTPYIGVNLIALAATVFFLRAWRALPRPSGTEGNPLPR